MNGAREPSNSGEWGEFIYTDDTTFGPVNPRIDPRHSLRQVVLQVLVPKQEIPK